MTIRKVVFWTHLSLGFVAGAVILLMSVTGVLLAYRQQITAWVHRDIRSTPSGDATRLPVETLLAGVAAVNGGAPSTITLRSDPGAPAEVGFGRDHLFFVDVYTGRVIGEASSRTRSFFQVVENWHRWLAASTDHRAAGRGITGACNLAFLFLVASGPFLWIPRRMSRKSVIAIATFGSGLSGRARDFNRHNVIGIWCAIPLSVVVVSGVVMSYPWANNLLYRLTGSELPVQGGGGRGERGERPGAGRKSNVDSQLDGFNALWVKAEQAVPGWRSLTARMDASGRGPVTFTIDTGNGGRPDQRAQLTLNRRTAETVRWEPFSNYNAGRRLRSWLRFLHTGEAGGVIGETVAAIASAGAAFLVWTGIWLACMRFLRRRSGSVNREAASQDRTVAASV